MLDRKQGTAPGTLPALPGHPACHQRTPLPRASRSDPARQVPIARLPVQSCGCAPPSLSRACHLGLPTSCDEPAGPGLRPSLQRHRADASGSGRCRWCHQRGRSEPRSGVPERYRRTPTQPIAQPWPRQSFRCSFGCLGCVKMPLTLPARVAMAMARLAQVAHRRCSPTIPPEELSPRSAGQKAGFLRNRPALGRRRPRPNPTKPPGNAGKEHAPEHQ